MHSGKEAIADSINKTRRNRANSYGKSSPDLKAADVSVDHSPPGAFHV